MKIDKNIQLITDMVSLYSPYGEEEKISDFLVQKMNEYGLRSYKDNAGNAIGIVGEGKKQILFAGHMDVFPGKIKVEVKDGKLYGRGSVDAKGSMAAFIRACANLDDETKKQKQIVIACCVEEEGPSSKGARALLENKEINPNYIFIGEPSGWDGITLGYKGILSFSHTFSQNNFHYGADEERVTDKAVKFLSLLQQKINLMRHESFFNSPSLEVRSINSDNNGLEEMCKISVAIRIPPKFDLKELQEWVVKEIKEEIDFTQSDPAVVSDTNNLLFKNLRQSILSQGGRGVPKKKYGTCDMNILGPHYGVPIVAYGPGDSKLDHTPDEHLNLEEYQKSIKVLEGTLKMP